MKQFQIKIFICYNFQNFKVEVNHYVKNKKKM